MPQAAPDHTIHNAAWSGHHLILADEDVVDHKIRRPLLSPSVAAGYNNCPASVVIGRLQPWDDDPFAANSMGTAAHAVMEELMLLPPDERTLECAYAILEKAANEQWSIAKLEKQNDEHLRANADNRTLWLTTLKSWIEATFLAIDPPSIEVETTEFLLDNIVIGKGIGGAEGIPLKGYVDLTEWVMRDGKKVRLIDDWKYGKPKVKVNPRYGDDYGDQQRTYHAGYTESTGEAPAGARLIFPRGLVGVPGAHEMSKKQREALTIRNIDVSPNEMRKTLLGFRAGWNTMNESCDRRAFEARPSGLCGWCPAANSCPVAKLPNQKALDAAASQPSALQLGIPTLRPGASLQEVRDAPGVTVPLRREPDFETTIEPVGDDMFPVTLLEDGDTEESVRPAPAAAADPAIEEPPFDPSYEPPMRPEDEPYEAVIPEQVIPAPAEETEQIGEIAAAFAANPSAFAAADDPYATEWFRAVHVEGEGTSTTEGDSTRMSDYNPEQPIQVKAEAQPYEAEINGVLNLNSYSAMAACGLVALAFEHMRSQNVKVGPASLNKFSLVLAGIVLRVQKQTTGFKSFQSGANTRLRGFLHMALEAFPAPFRVLVHDGSAYVPATAEDWQTWVSRIENLITVSLVTAVTLYETADQHLNTSPESYFAVGGEGAPAPVAAAVATA
ncbi:MAG: PD-(D/E)XK nuclease family protein [Microbacterium sp.]|uniref:RecB family exonuclease n=1 Tax=Microbacterium sp. TaxID=51671 RepID=UPI001AC513EA|nr:PD-(D/E)XK nuclease family protein [Microbacterium sp.]MBN9214688.1 PD-(D/E)XK nuclease family protein [Microbacterium sp.]